MDKKKILKNVAYFAAGYGAFLTSLWFLQDRLVFRGAKSSRERFALDATSEAISRCFAIRSESGQSITCFEVGDATKPAILVLPGNGGNAVKYMKWMSSQIKRHFPDETFRIVSLHYRGYGLTGGRPCVKGALSDILSVCSSSSVSSVFGRSLGAGLGAVVAARLSLPAVLVSPWDSLPDVASDKTVGVIPRFLSRRIFRHKLFPFKDAVLAKSKLVAICFSEDSTVTPRRTKKLFDSWGGEKVLRSLPGRHEENVDLTREEVALLLHLPQERI